MEPPQAVLPHYLPRELLQTFLGQPASVPKSAAFSTRTAMCKNHVLVGHGTELHQCRNH